MQVKKEEEMLPDHDDLMLSFINQDFCGDSCGIEGMDMAHDSPPWSSGSSDGHPSTPPTPPLNDVSLNMNGIDLDSLISSHVKLENGNAPTLDSLLAANFKLDDIASLLNLVPLNTASTPVNTTSTPANLLPSAHIESKPVKLRPIASKSANTDKPIARSHSPANSTSSASSTPQTEVKMTAEQKKQERLIKNRAAALNSRKRKREQFSLMEVQVDIIKAENETLKSTIARMEKEANEWKAEKKTLLQERDALRKEVAAQRPKSFDIDLENNVHVKEEKSKSPGVVLMIMLFSFAIFSLPSTSSFGRLSIGGGGTSRNLIGPATELISKAASSASPPVSQPSVMVSDSSVSEWLLDQHTEFEASSFAEDQDPDAFMFCSPMTKNPFIRNSKSPSSKPARLAIIAPVDRKDVIVSGADSKDLVLSPRRQPHWSSSAERRKARQSQSSMSSKSSRHVWRAGGTADAKRDYLLRLDVDLVASNWVPMSDIDDLDVSWSSFAPDDLDDENVNVATNTTGKKRLWNVAGRK